jgi:predicted dehydrogenase
MSIVNTALLSYGMSGRVFHAPFIDQHPGFALLSCWERSTKRIKKHYASVRSYDTLDDLLADDAIDLVVVNTPTYTHYDFTKKVLQSGKHVIVEKAFAGNTDEARELLDLAKDVGRTLSVFQNRRWDSHFLCVRKILEDGVLGDVVEANLGFCRFDPELSPKVHKEEPSSGAGIVKDLGPHVIDQALVLFGMPEGVFADIGITRQHSKVDDYFDILLLYGDKRVHVRAGYFYRHPLTEYTLFGKRGCFLKERADVQEPQLDEGMKPTDDGYGVEPDGCEGRLYVGDGDEPQLVPSPPGNYMPFYEGVYESITGGRPEPVSAEDGVRVMRVIDAAFRSHREGKVIAP